jgi:alpha/beta superfamily hydrolase
MSPSADRACWIEHDGLRLEGLLREGSSPLAAVVLHPHPQYGGDMHNHVVAGLVDALDGIGISTLRFNFRGVGDSGGAYDGGAGETEDALAAIDFLRKETGTSGIILAGYSFGAMVAASASGQRPLAGLLLVSPPLGFAPLPPLPAGVPTLIAGGDRDALAPAASVRALDSPGTRVVIIQGADHGWWPGLEALAGETAKFAAQLVAPLSDA